MKIETIYVLERKNLGNYEHIEMSATAKIEEGEDPFLAMIKLKETVHQAIEGKTASIVNAATTQQLKEEVKEVIAEAVQEVTAEVKERKQRTKKVANAETKTNDGKTDTIGNLEGSETVANEGVSTGVLADETTGSEKKEKASRVTKYSSDIPEHKSIFGAYLTKKYADRWKTVKPAAEIKAFTASLNGKDFIDENGSMVPSFLDTVHGFFGA